MDDPEPKLETLNSAFLDVNHGAFCFCEEASKLRLEHGRLFSQYISRNFEACKKGSASSSSHGKVWDSLGRLEETDSQISIFHNRDGLRSDWCRHADESRRIEKSQLKSGLEELEVLAFGGVLLPMEEVNCERREKAFDKI